MIDTAGSEGLVCLHFPASKDKANLYAHKSFLRCCSGVLKSLLDEDSSLVTVPQQQQQQPSKVAKLQAGTSAAAAAAAVTHPGLPVIPMPDEDTTAWEEALALMYPMPPGVLLLLLLLHAAVHCLLRWIHMHQGYIFQRAMRTWREPKWHTPSFAVARRLLLLCLRAAVVSCVCCCNHGLCNACCFESTCIQCIIS
jgi:hypothetical protein